MTWMRVEEMEKKMQKCAEDPKERMTTPQADGFFMPGEYEPHDGCIIVWPQRPGSWSFGAVAACEAFTAVIKAIAASENAKVLVISAKIEEDIAQMDDADVVCQIGRVVPIHRAVLYGKRFGV